MKAGVAVLILVASAALILLCAQACNQSDERICTARGCDFGIMGEYTVPVIPNAFEGATVTLCGPSFCPSTVIHRGGCDVTVDGDGMMCTYGADKASGGTSFNFYRPVNARPGPLPSQPPADEQVTLTVVAADGGATIFETAGTAHYIAREINGPGCGICWQAPLNQ
jgi:hypothetical protein